jgi:hypothetical protein
MPTMQQPSDTPGHHARSSIIQKREERCVERLLTLPQRILRRAKITESKVDHCNFTRD